jgi:putative glutamine amidotransferase
MPRPKSPRVLVTLAVVAEQAEPDLAARRAELYLEAVRRHGGDPVAVDAKTAPADLAAALASMDGLLLSGGGDLDPARYGEANLGSVDIDAGRDELEATAWKEATARGLPVLGICRGLQAINVFSGGSLLQHVDDHAGPGWGIGEPATHPISVVPGTRLGDLLDPRGADDDGPPLEPLVVNAYHHQGVREQDLAPGLIAAAWADSAAGPLVEGLESTESRFVIGVQCHPERTESTPRGFERVFEAFVSAATPAGMASTAVAPERLLVRNPHAAIVPRPRQK